MSIDILSPSIETPVEVLVESYRGEPVRLNAVGCGKGRVEVIGSDPGKSISLPEALVHQYSAEKYQELLAAFEKGCENDLKSLWDKVDLCALAT